MPIQDNGCHLEYLTDKTHKCPTRSRVVPPSEEDDLVYYFTPKGYMKTTFLTSFLTFQAYPTAHEDDADPTRRCLASTSDSLSPQVAPALALASEPTRPTLSEGGV